MKTYKITMLGLVVLLVVLLFMVVHLDREIQELQFEHHNLEKVYSEYAEKLYCLEIERDNLSKELSMHQEKLDITREECDRLRQSNIKLKLSK